MNKHPQEHKNTIEVECEHDYAEFEVTNDKDFGVVIDDVACPDCELTSNDKITLIKNFDWNRYFEKGDTSDE